MSDDEHMSKRAKSNEVEVEERVCRYCLEGDVCGDSLISPCECSGSAQYVHLQCLRKWQRMSIVTEPTHPACA